MSYVNAVLIGEKFPGKRVDFLTQQVVNLIKIRPDSKVIVLHDSEKIEDESGPIKKHNILEKTFFLNLPKGNFNRLLSVPLIFSHPLVFLKSLSPKYYPMNLTLKHYLTYLAIKKLPFKINTLHCHFGQIGIIGAFLKNTGLCKNLIISFYGGDLTGYVNTYGKDIYKETFATADSLVACSEFLKKKLIELGAEPKKIVSVNLPQDSNFFKPKKVKRKSKDIVILTIARLVKEKGVQNSLKAIQIISNKYKNLKYVIVGDGDYKAELEKLVEKYSLQDIVEFKGIRAGKESLKEYQNADIFVLPRLD